MAEKPRFPVGIRIEGNCRDIRIIDNKFRGVEPVVIGSTANVVDLEYRGNDSSFPAQRLRLSESDVREIRELLAGSRSQLDAAGPSNFETTVRGLPIFGRLSAKAIEVGANIATIVAFAKDLFFGR